MGKSESRGNSALKVEMWALGKLKPYENNPRVHDDDQVEAIARSIQEFGFTVPIIADPDGEIIAGHGREMAAKRLSIKKVPVLVAIGWSEAKKRAYRIADNAIALRSEWSLGALEAEVSRLVEIGEIGIEALGLDVETLEAIDFGVEVTQPVIGAQEIAKEGFEKFDRQCPRCGFEFDE